MPLSLFGWDDMVANIALSGRSDHVFDEVSYPPSATGRSIPREDSAILMGFPDMVFDGVLVGADCEIFGLFSALWAGANK